MNFNWEKVIWLTDKEISIEIYYRRFVLSLGLSALSEK